MVGASYDNISMVEGESSEVSEDEIVEALKVAHEAIKSLCELQNELLKKSLWGRGRLLSFHIFAHPGKFRLSQGRKKSSPYNTISQKFQKVDGENGGNPPLPQILLKSFQHPFTFSGRMIPGPISSLTATADANPLNRYRYKTLIPAPGQNRSRNSDRLLSVKYCIAI